MVKERKQLSRRWLWFGLAVVLVAVYFVAPTPYARSPACSCRARWRRLRWRAPLPRTAGWSRKKTSKFTARFRRGEGSVRSSRETRLPAGKLLMQLDDIDARAKLASAESAVKSAQARLRQPHKTERLSSDRPARRTLRATSWSATRLSTILDALQKLNSTGAASASEVAAADSGWQPPKEPARGAAELTEPLLACQN